MRPRANVWVFATVVSLAIGAAAIAGFRLMLEAVGGEHAADWPPSLVSEFLSEGGVHVVGPRALEVYDDPYRLIAECRSFRLDDKMFEAGPSAGRGRRFYREGSGHRGWVEFAPLPGGGFVVGVIDGADTELTQSTFPGLFDEALRRRVQAGR